jgi:hypothetical protein
MGLLTSHFTQWLVPELSYVLMKRTWNARNDANDQVGTWHTVKSDPDGLAQTLFPNQSDPGIRYSISVELYLQNSNLYFETK